MNRAAGYGTAIVLVHLLVNIIHGEAHRVLKIDLGLLGMRFDLPAPVKGRFHSLDASYSCSFAICTYTFGTFELHKPNTACRV